MEGGFALLLLHLLGYSWLADFVNRALGEMNST